LPKWVFLDLEHAKYAVSGTNWWIQNGVKREKFVLPYTLAITVATWLIEFFPCLLLFPVVPALDFGILEACGGRRAPRHSINSLFLYDL